MAASTAALGVGAVISGCALYGKLVPPATPFGTYDGEYLAASSLPGDIFAPTSGSVVAKPRGYEACETVNDLRAEVARRFHTRPCLGTRELIEAGSDEKGFEKLTLGAYTYITYAEFESSAKAFASGLCSLTGVVARDIVTVYAETKAEWMLALHGCMAANLQVATVYATLGAEGASFAINQTDSKVCVADSKLLKTLLTVSEECKQLKYVVTIGNVQAKLLADAKAKGLTVLSTAEVIKAGMGKNVSTTPAKPSDIAVIMYTSGTTGAPKGVLISHANILAGVAGLTETAMSGKLTSDSEIVYLAYLPLAHIMELALEHVMLCLGAALAYGSPGTLTDSAPKIKNCIGDAREARPTVLVCAPAVLDKIRSAVTSKITKSSKTKQLLFKLAYNTAIKRRTKNIKRGFVGSPPFWNKLVFSKMQALLGGRVQWIASGSAPLDPDTQAFVECCFNLPIVQGYALTETCCGGCGVSAGDVSPGTVGGPMACCMYKLEDWEEGGYKKKDKDDPSINAMRGEVHIGGPSVTMGYFIPSTPPRNDMEAKNIEELKGKNSNDFYTDANGTRWFKTGDIGAVDNVQKRLAIVDRKKDLVKLRHGEYVALSKVEGVLQGAAAIDQVLCVGKGTMTTLCAVIVPSKDHMVANGANTEAEEEALCKEAKYAEAFGVIVKDAAKKRGLSKTETPSVIVLSPHPWTVENDLLTAAQKKKRPQILASVQDLVDAKYK